MKSWKESTIWFVVAAAFGIVSWASWNFFAFYKGTPHFMIVGNAIAAGMMSACASFVAFYRAAILRWAP